MYDELVKTFIIIIIGRLLKNTYYDNRITELEGKMPNISGLAPTSAFNSVENKAPNVSDLLKKADYDRKISNSKEKAFYCFPL